MELAQVSENQFCRQVLCVELDAIVSDIRTNNEKDSSTAELETDAKVLVDDMKQILENALNYEGTADEKRAFMVCRTLDINHAVLSVEE